MPMPVYIESEGVDAETLETLGRKLFHDVLDIIVRYKA